MCRLTNRLVKLQSFKVARRFLLNRISRSQHGYRRWSLALLRALSYTIVSTIAQFYPGVRIPVVVLVARNGHHKASFFVEDHQTASRQLRADGIDTSKAMVICDSEPPINPALRRILDRDLRIACSRRWSDATIARYRLAAGGTQRRYLPLRHLHSSDIWKRIGTKCRFTDAEIDMGRYTEAVLADGKQYICWSVADKRRYQEQDLLAGITARDPSCQSRYDYAPNRETYLAATSNLETPALTPIEIESARVTMDAEEHTAWLSRSGALPGFAETWLFGNCYYFLSGGTGAWWLAAIFDRPVVVTDVYNLQAFPPGIDIFIPQLCWVRSERRFLTFAEIARMGHWAGSRRVVESQLEIVKNSADDIAEVCTELGRHLSGITDDLDQELQDRFWVALRRSGCLDPAMVSATVRIGEDFLRRHQQLLGD